MRRLVGDELVEHSVVLLIVNTTRAIGRAICERGSNETRSTGDTHHGDEGEPQRTQVRVVEHYDFRVLGDVNICMEEGAHWSVWSLSRGCRNVRVATAPSSLVRHQGTGDDCWCNRSRALESFHPWSTFHPVCHLAAMTSGVPDAPLPPAPWSRLQSATRRLVGQYRLTRLDTFGAVLDGSFERS